ncbi:MAG: DUF502 domain-containing protein [Bacteroidales bacterium]
MKLKSLGQEFLKYFFNGLIYVAPITLTIYAIVVLFNFIDGILNKYIEKVFNIEIPGLGFVGLIVIITLLGVVGSSILFKPIIDRFDKWIQKAPFVKDIYSAIKDLLSAFVGQKKRFTNPVMVKVNTSSDIYKLGFVTSEDLRKIGVKGDFIAVYLPHSYAWSGNMFIVPSKNVKKIEASSTEVMKFIISGGVTNWSDNSNVNDDEE